MAITVQVQQGTLAGTASADGVVRAFLGVPYAQPPVGPLRWRLPQPPAPWEGQRPADSFGPNSPQFPMLPNSLFAGGHENQSEDCLYLNVWTAAQSAQERRPVIVFVHLGAFQYGGSSLEIYGGESLARQGPVVVTINYRLNRFGFFAHPTSRASRRTGRRATTGCTIRSPRSSGFAPTSARSVAIRTASRCSASRPEASASTH
jgi:para-nitrobenzyl esterase